MKVKSGNHILCWWEAMDNNYSILVGAQQKSEYTSEILAGHTSEAFLPKQAPEREVSAVEKHWVAACTDAAISILKVPEIQSSCL